MIKRWLFALSVLSMLTAFATIVAAQGASNETVHKQLQAMCDRWTQDWVKEDMTAIAASFTPDYRGTAGGKTYNRTQWLAVLKGFADIQRLDRAQFKVGKVSAQGDKATAIAVYTDSGVVKDPQGREHPETYRERLRYTWKKTPEGWKFQRAHSLQSKMTVDGKPVNPDDPFGASGKKKR